MKKLKSQLFVISMLLVFAIAIGCSKESDNPIDLGTVIKSEASITFNGAGFTNNTVTLGNGGCSYSPSENLTVATFSGAFGTDSLILVFQFVGNQTGARPWSSSEPDALIYKYGTSGTFYFYADSTGTTNITGYGAVSGKVEGNISGKLVEASTQTELNISGNFSALRIPDSE